MRRLLFLSILLSCAWPGAQGQTLEVWPGDVNDNGVANHVDFLFLGLPYGATGPARAMLSFDWLAQEATAWAGNFPDGVNFAHADCDGDGTVDQLFDAIPILLNFGQTHGVVTPDVFVEGMAGIDPPVFFDTTDVSWPAPTGQHFTLPLVLGTAALPLDDFYGLAFSIFFDPPLADACCSQFNLEQLSWANPDFKGISLSAASADASRIDVSWVRTDQQAVSGFGPIGDASFIVIDDVVGIQQMMIRIDSIKVIDAFGNESALAGDTAWVSVSSGVLSAASTEVPALSVHPNPANGHLMLEAPTPVREAKLFDAAGRLAAQCFPDQAAYQWLLPPLPGGFYLLRARLDSGATAWKIKINDP